MARAIWAVVALIAVQHLHAMDLDSAEASLSADSTAPGAPNDIPLHQKTSRILSPLAPNEPESPAAAAFDKDTKAKVWQAFKDTKKSASANDGAISLNQKKLASSTKALEQAQSALKQYQISGDVEELPDAASTNTTESSAPAAPAAPAATSPLMTTAAEQATASQVQAASDEAQASEMQGKAERESQKLDQEKSMLERKTRRLDKRVQRKAKRIDAQSKAKVKQVKADAKKEEKRMKRKAKRQKKRMKRRVQRVKKDEKQKLKSMKLTLEEKMALMTKKSEAAVQAANARASALKVRLDLALAKKTVGGKNPAGKPAAAAVAVANTTSVELLDHELK